MKKKICLLVVAASLILVACGNNDTVDTEKDTLEGANDATTFMIDDSSVVMDDENYDYDEKDTSLVTDTEDDLDEDEHVIAD